MIGGCLMSRTNSLSCRPCRAICAASRPGARRRKPRQVLIKSLLIRDNRRQPNGLSLAESAFSCYIWTMGKELSCSLPAQFAAELERKFFWWEPVGLQPRSDARILAQAMTLASFDDIRRLETTLGPHMLAEAMLVAEPGWFNGPSWELWRGRLALATNYAIPEAPPRRSFDAGPV